MELGVTINYRKDLSTLMDYYAMPLMEATPLFQWETLTSSGVWELRALGLAQTRRSRYLEHLVNLSVQELRREMSSRIVGPMSSKAESIGGSEGSERRLRAI